MTIALVSTLISQLTALIPNSTSARNAFHHGLNVTAPMDIQKQQMTTNGVLSQLHLPKKLRKSNHREIKMLSLNLSLDGYMESLAKKWK